MLVGFESKAATAICTFAYSAGPGSEPLIFEGRTEGQIVPARGATRFGWDPVFLPDGFDTTCVSVRERLDCHICSAGLTPTLVPGRRRYAEMDGAAKNAISHRGRALEKLKQYLETLPQ